MNEKPKNVNDQIPYKYKFDFDSEQLIDADPVQSEMGGTVAPILFRYDGKRTKNMGTAFCIAHSTSGEAIYVTARHVVEGLENATNIEPMLLLPTHEVEEKKENLTGIFIEQVSVSPSHSDVAIVTISPKSSPSPVAKKIKVLKISYDEPVIGMYVMGLGYAHPNQTDEEEKAEFNISYQFKASRGRIEELHKNQRDTFQVNFPSFRTTGKYLRSMSGGPVIDQSGKVIGVISTGIDNEGEPIGYATTMPCIAELVLTLTREDGVREDVSLEKLIGDGMLGEVNFPFTFSRSDEGVNVTWHRTPEPEI